MRSDTMVNKKHCLVIHYPAVEKYTGIPQSSFAAIIESEEAGVTLELIREFNTENSICTVVKKSQANVIRRRAIAIYLHYLPKELQDELNEGYIQKIF